MAQPHHDGGASATVSCLTCRSLQRRIATFVEYLDALREQDGPDEDRDAIRWAIAGWLDDPPPNSPRGGAGPGAPIGKAS